MRHDLFTESRTVTTVAQEGVDDMDNESTLGVKDCDSSEVLVVIPDELQACDGTEDRAPAISLSNLVDAGQDDVEQRPRAVRVGVNRAQCASAPVTRVADIAEVPGLHGVDIGHLVRKRCD